MSSMSTSCCLVISVVFLKDDTDIPSVLHLKCNMRFVAQFLGQTKGINYPPKLLFSSHVFPRSVINLSGLSKSLQVQTALPKQSSFKKNSSWWLQSIWKISSSNWIISPSMDENIKYLKPPPRTTVDGKKNPAPVDMANLTLFTGFYTSGGERRISSITSTTIMKKETLW